MGTASIATKAPTVHHFSQRPFFANILTREDAPFTRYIIQSYIQSSTRLEKDVFMKYPKELGVQDDRVPRIVKPLYGIPESSFY